MASLIQDDDGNTAIYLVHEDGHAHLAYEDGTPDTVEFDGKTFTKANRVVSNNRYTAEVYEEV